ncbi:hypothetical protein OF83DRAFT_1134312, partial [Amylostereum chailletii]
TCSGLKKRIDATPSLQYTLALAGSGMRDGPDKSLPVVERVDRIKTYNATWRTLSWSKEYTFHIKYKGKLTESPTVFGGLLAVQTARAVHLYQLHSPLRGVEAKEWTLTFDFDVGKVVVDPSQDLLVLLGHDHARHGTSFRSLSTGEPHADALNTICPQPVPERGTAIFGEHVGYGARDSVSVYGWKKPSECVAFVSQPLATTSWEFIAALS